MDARFLNEAGSIIRVEDETGVRDVPADAGNSDYAALIASGTPIAAFQAPPPTADDVRAEARRRILAVYPDWKQLNMNARATELTSIEMRQGSLTPEEETERGALEAAWQWIKSVRAASNAMEADPPADFADDANWPANP